MTKRYAVFALLLSLGLLPWSAAQTNRTDLFDSKKSQQELEIMRGILGTTLNFVVREINAASTPEPESREKIYVTAGYSHIEAFYLYGQGAIFIIPGSSFRQLGAKSLGAGRAFEQELDILVRQQAVLEAAQAREQAAFEAAIAKGVAGGVVGGIVGGVGGGVSGGIVGGVPSGAETPKARGGQTPTPAPSASQVDSVRRRLAEAQDKVKKSREETEQKRAKLREYMAQVKVYLIEALANHGDSLTHVRPNEYLTIIITSDFGFPHDFVFTGARGQKEVISVLKSVITDYKAGRLSLDAFKSKTLQYTS